MPYDETVVPLSREPLEKRGSAATPSFTGYGAGSSALRRVTAFDGRNLGRASLAAALCRDGRSARTIPENATLRKASRALKQECETHPRKCEAREGSPVTSVGAAA